MARSRRPPTFVISGVLRRVWACRCDSQFPTRMPVDFTLFTRLIPCASSGASKPLSAASAASLRMADILMMIEEDPSPRSSSDTRHALTVALVNPGRGACWNHPINSLSAMLYTRFVIGEETLSSTNAFNFSHCAIFSIAITFIHFESRQWALSEAKVIRTLPLLRAKNQRDIGTSGHKSCVPGQARYSMSPSRALARRAPASSPA
jgi:hypothetical protein